MIYRKLLLIFIAVLMCGSSFGQLPPNGGFEEWTSQFIPRPENWHAAGLSTGLSCPGGVSSHFQQTTDAYEGELAIFLETELCFDIDIGPVLNFGYVHSGNTGVFPPYFSSIDFSERPESLSFYYKVELFGGDTAVADIILFNYDIDDNSITDTIGIARAFFTSDVTEYTEYQLPIIYLMDINPSFCRVWFNTSISSIRDLTNNTPDVHGHAGTNMTIDKVEFQGGTLSNKEEIGEVRFSIFPNPNQGAFLIDGLLMSEDYLISIYNAKGQMILRRSVSYRTSIQVDDDLVAGLYQVHLVGSASGALSKQVLIIR